MKTITTTIDIAATPSRVWAILTDFADHQRWNPFFFGVEGAPIVGSQLKIRSRSIDGSRGVGFAPRVLDVEPEQLLRWRGHLLVRGLFDGTHTFELTPSESGGTRFDHSESFRGILVPLLGKVLSDTERGFEEFNAALKSECEEARA